MNAHGATEHFDLLKAATGPIGQVSVRSLRPADSPRLEGEDPEHIRMLAAVEATLPPIIVHRVTMRVIDGMHRLGAARLRGDEFIEVRFFEGSEQEAFVLAVKANIAHGRPLSLADRTAAAERIMTAHPTWSDRALAAAAGISVRMVAGMRRKLEIELESFEGGRTRVGRDGRVRPVDGAAGRLKAAEVIRDFPNASLREIGSRAGVSPATARDVRRRVQRGELPVLNGHDRIRRPSGGSTPRAGQAVAEPGVATMLQGLRGDPSLRFSESGRGLLRWVLTKALRPQEWSDVADDVPPHTTYLLADVARRTAEQWREVADELEQRLRQMT